MRSICCIVFILVLNIPTVASDPIADSLLNDLYRSQINDDEDLYDHFCDIAFYSDDADTVLKYSEKAIQLAEELHKSVAQAIIYLGRGYLLSYKPASALERFMNALGNYQTFQNRLGQAITYTWIARTYELIGDLDNEKQYYQDAIRIFKEENDSSNLNLAFALHNLGYAYYRTREYDSALVLFEETGDLFHQLGSLEDYAYNLGNVGLVYSKQLKYDLAGEYLNRAIEMLSEQGNTYAVTEFMIEYATILQHQGKIEEAINDAHICLDYAEENGIVEYKQGAAQCLARLYESIGRYDRAFYYQTLYIQATDSINNNTSRKSILDMADQMTEFEVAKTQARLDAAERKRTIQWIGMGGLAIILLLAVGFVVQYYNSLKRTRKLATSLEERGILLERQSTELKEQKEALMQQKEELQVTLENLRKTQEQLVESEKMAAVGSLVAGVAHEMNTPVGVGITAVSNLRDDVSRMTALYEESKISREEFKGFLESSDVIAKLIHKNLEKAASLIQSFTQISTDQVTEQQRVFACREYLSDIVTSFRPKFSGKNIHVHIDCDDELTLNSYPGVYAQIFTNLLSNSLQHGYYKKDNGTITLKVQKENETLKILYSDDGAGISKKDLHHIFEPFYTSDQHRGTGLGLNIIYNLVKQKLHGNISCESEPGKGVTFTITVPYYT